MNEHRYEKGEYSSLQRDVNEFESVDIINVLALLWRGKLIIIFFIVIALILGFLYTSFAKEKWISNATVTLPASGQVANYNAALSVIYSDNPLDKPTLVAIQSQLFGRFSASMSALSNSLKNLEEPVNLTVTVPVGSADSLNISLVATNAKEAQSQLTKYIEHINDEVVLDYGNDIKRSVDVKTRELSNAIDTYRQVALDKKAHRIEVIKQALKIAQVTTVNKLQVNQAEFLSDDTLYLLGSDALSAMVQNESTKPLDFPPEYYDVQRALLGVTHLKVEVDNLQSYRYISQADLPIRRDSPKKSLILFLSLILGALIGSATVIGKNALGNYRSLK